VSGTLSSAEDERAVPERDAEPKLGVMIGLGLVSCHFSLPAASALPVALI
jgi:hypothetical protein